MGKKALLKVHKTTFLSAAILNIAAMLKKKINELEAYVEKIQYAKTLSKYGQPEFYQNIAAMLTAILRKKL